MSINTEPRFTELTAETAAEYALWLAAIFGQTIASVLGKRIEDGETVYSFRLSDGTTAEIWLQAGFVYGEA